MRLREETKTLGRLRTYVIIYTNNQSNMYDHKEGKQDLLIGQQKQE